MSDKCRGAMRIPGTMWFGGCVLATCIAEITACSTRAPQSNASQLQFTPDQAAYVLQGYGSGNPATLVDEWDVAQVTKDGASYVVARGYEDAQDSDGTLDPAAGRTAVIDVVAPPDGSSLWIQAPNSDDMLPVDDGRRAALTDDFDAMQAALGMQSQIAGYAGSNGDDAGDPDAGGEDAPSEAGEDDAGEPVDAEVDADAGEDAGEDAGDGDDDAAMPMIRHRRVPRRHGGTRIRTESGMASGCGSLSQTAAQTLASARNWLSGSAPTSAASGSASSAPSTLSSASPVCPVQSGTLVASVASDLQSDLNDVLATASRVKRFFERNRKLIAQYASSTGQDLVGLLRCLLSQFKGIYLYGELEIPGSSVASYVASKGVSLPTNLYSQAAQMVPGLNARPGLELCLYGGLDLGASTDVTGGFIVASNLFRFFVPIVGVEMYVSNGAELSYDFTSKTWEGPSYVAFAGDIPAWAGVPLGIGGYVTRGDDIGFFINYNIDIESGEASTGIIVSLSRSSLAAFGHALMAGTIASGCSSTPGPSMPSTGASCGNAADGQYCGDDGIANGLAGTLYQCTAGVLAPAASCANGCTQGADPGTDYCN